MLFWFLLFVGIIILTIIFAPKLIKLHAANKFALEGLSSLEASVLKDLQAQNPLASRSHILYLFCLKPISVPLKRALADEIIEDFPEHSEAHLTLSQILAPQDLDQLYREYQQSRRPAPKPVRLQPMPAERLVEASRRPDTFIFDDPAPPLEQLFMFDFIDDQEFLRQIHAFNEFEQKTATKRTRHFYEHNENVHALSSDCLAKAQNLVNRYRDRFSEIEFEREIEILLMNAPSDISPLSAIERARSDRNKYGYAPNDFRLSQLLFSIIMYIKLDSPENTRVELQKRLYQELAESKGKCGTGHVVRFMNVLKGFDTPYDHKLPIKDEVYARVCILAQKAIQNSERMDDILDDNETMVRFLQQEQKNIFNTLHNEYKEISSELEIREQVNASLNKYTKTTIFK